MCVWNCPNVYMLSPSLGLVVECWPIVVTSGYCKHSKLSLVFGAYHLNTFLASTITCKVFLSPNVLIVTMFIIII